MKLAVVGSRTYAESNVINSVLTELWPDEIVTGGAKGADRFAEAWATLHQVPVKVFLPDWSLGKKAGPMRNKKIVDYCDQLVAFWDGKSRGTLSSIELAKKQNKLLRVYLEQ